MRPGIDIVVVTFNSEACIEANLLSINDFFGTGGYRLLVIDNASTDSTLTKLRDSGIPYELVTNERNLGFAAAVNRGLQIVDSEVVLLLNPDVSRLDGDKEAVRRIFAADTRVASVAGSLRLEDGQHERSCHTFPTLLTWWSEALGFESRLPWWGWARKHNLLDWDMESERVVDDACGGFLFLRTEAVRDVGPLDERFFLYWEETDWLLRANQRGWRTVYTPGVSATHGLRRSSSVAPDLMRDYLLRNGYRYMRKRLGITGELVARAGFLIIDSVKLVKHLGYWGDPRRHQKLNTDMRRIRAHLGTKGPECV